MNNYSDQVKNYFRLKADKYDLVDEQLYWRLSDELLWHCLSTIVLDNLSDNFTFLDAGGGTGRWSCKILEKYRNTKGTICDISTDMLAIARAKKEKRNLKLELHENDIEAMPQFSNESFDISFNFHNVLGFVNSPLKTIKELRRVTKVNGYIISVVPNYYHAIFFNLFIKNIDEAEHIIASGSGKFTSDMPNMNLFTPDSIIGIYSQADIEIVNTIGFPICIYPGFQETQLTGSSEYLANLLDDRNNYNRILAIEKKMIFNQEAFSRGNNLLIIGKKGK